MLGSFFAQIRGLPVYSDIGARVLANYRQLVKEWPSDRGYGGLPDLQTYANMQNTEDLKNTHRRLGYREFKNLFKANQILFYKNNPENVDTASINFLFVERENMRKILEESSTRPGMHIKALAAYGTLCRLEDADYAYARLADLPDKDGYLHHSLRLASITSNRETFASVPFDPDFMPVYMVAKEEVDAEIAAMKKPGPSWRVPDTGHRRTPL